jgi:AraC-like DNA-binding protein
MVIMGKFDYALSIVNTFRNAFGMNCFVADMSLRSIKPGGDYFFCNLCYEKQIRENGCARCENLMKYAVYQSERWGGKYEFMCPTGAAFIAVSGIKPGKPEYGLISGPFLMISVKDYLSDDYMGVFKGQTKDISVKTKELPFIEPQRVSSMADMLYMLIAYAAERDNDDIRFLKETHSRYNEMFNAVMDMKTGSVQYKYPIDAEKRLQRYVASGDKQAAQRTLNEILGAIYFSSGSDETAIKTRVSELLVLLSRAAIEGGADVSGILGLNRNYLQEVMQFKNLDDLSTWLSVQLSNLIKLVFAVSDTKHTDTIKKVMEYVNANYMNRISLNDISEYVSFNMSYLSRMFKEEKGMNLTTYINKVRIRNAKKLLLETNETLSAITYLCGFDDQSYFSKVFKKETGLSPMKYRETGGI